MAIQDPVHVKTTTGIPMDEHPTAIHGVNAYMGSVHNFKTWGDSGPIPMQVMTSIPVMRIPGSTTYSDDQAIYRQFSGSIVADAWDADYLQIGSASYENLVNLPALTDPDFTHTPFQSVPGLFTAGERPYWCYSYLIEVNGELYETHVSLRHDWGVGGAYAVHITMPAHGSYTVLATKLYREERPFNNTGPFKYVGEVAGNGGTVTDDVLEADLGAEGDTVNRYHQAWRCGIRFDTSGASGEVVNATLRVNEYPGSSNTDYLWWQCYLRRGDHVSQGFGIVYTTSSWNVHTGAGWVLASEARSDPRRSHIDFQINAAGIDEINEAIAAGLQTHVVLKKADEDPQVASVWKMGAGDFATETSRPYLNLEIDAVSPPGVFPGQLNRSLLTGIGL